MIKKSLVLLFLLFFYQVKAELMLSPLVDGLDRVTFVGHANDERLFIAQQYGAILIYQNDALNPVPLLDVSGLVNSDFEEGLLSFAFHSNYQNNAYVFYSIAYNHTAAARYQR